MPMSA
jgi:type II secretory pathway predicted ATPase ExeA